ncbi:subclass B1 metallo-beta-lactamase [Candidatus Neomarinimicrobiota bacterium]
MKVMLYIVLIFLFSIFSPAQRNNNKSEAITENLILKEISKDVYLVTHSFPWSANSLLVRINQSDFVLVDTPWDNSGTKALVEWLRDNYENVNLSVINTHFHRDNLGGNEYLLNEKIPIYGSDLTVELLNEREKELIDRTLNNLQNLDNKKYYDAYKTTKLKRPDNIFNINNGLILKFGNEQVELFFPGPGHTPDNIVVYFPSKRLLFGGCMLKSLDSNLGRNSDAIFNEWSNSLNKISMKYHKAKIVVPGHGNCGNMELVTHTLQLLKR